MVAALRNPARFNCRISLRTSGGAARALSTLLERLDRSGQGFSLAPDASSRLLEATRPQAIVALLIAHR